MISSIEWIPKGVADPNPKAYELSAAEKELLEHQADLEEAEFEEDTPTTTSIELPKIDPKTLPPELRMDEYSSDEEDNEAVHGSAIGNMLVGHDSEMLEIPAGMDQDEDHGDEEGDDDKDEAPDDSKDDDDDSDSDDDLADVPDTREYMPTNLEGLEAMGLSQIGAGGTMYLDNMGDEDDDDEDSDIDDINLAPDDALVVVAKTEEDFAALEIHVYEPKTGNLFVHHDIPLPSFPLCLAHGDINSNGDAGNFCAVGTFSPGIEVWNLDVLNALEPSCILGGDDTSAADQLMKLNMARAASGKKLKKQQLASGGLRPESHTDAVMALSWNKVHRQVIASGSADCTVKLWDVTKATEGKANAATFTHHKDKVQSVQWHPSEGTLLATGSYDKTVLLVDARSGDSNYKRVKIPADCESLSWDPFHTQYLTVATEDGTISCWDVRKFDDPVWSFVANEFGGVSDLSYNRQVPGMLATCAIDKSVTLWDTYASGKPSNAPPLACGNKDMGVGKLYTISFYPSSPWLLGCGGGGNQLALWDLSSESAVLNRFGSRIGEEAVQEDTEDAKTEDFEAIMATGDAAAENVKADVKRKKKKGKGKKKAHKKGR